MPALVVELKHFICSSYDSKTLKWSWSTSTAPLLEVPFKVDIPAPFQMFTNVSQNVRKK